MRKLEWLPQSGRRHGLPVLVTLMSGVLTAIGTLAHTTAAGYSDPTTNVSNALQSGQVVVTDDDSGTAAFSTGAPRNNGSLAPGQVLSQCIAVSYNGSWAGSPYADDFNVQDTTQWSGFSANVVATGGALQITPTGAYPAASTTFGNQNFRDAAGTVDVAQVPNVGNNTTEAFFEVKLDASNSLYFVWTRSTLIARLKTNGVNDDSVSAAWNASSMRYWRIRSVGTTVFWEYSANATTWTTLRTATVAASMSAAYFVLGAGYYGTESSRAWPASTGSASPPMPACGCTAPRPATYSPTSD